MDFEKVNEHKIFDLTIVAAIENNKKNSLQVEQKIRFELSDSNDNCPEFFEYPSEFRIKIKSREPKTLNDLLIFSPKCRDMDKGDNSKIIYKLIDSQDSENYFDIDLNNGQVIFFHIIIYLYLGKNSKFIT